MLTSDVASTLFTALNALRLIGYLPQIRKISSDRHGAEAVSITTWTIFTVSNLSTVVYAALCLRDMQMSIVFAANTLCCLIVTVLASKRRKAARQNKPCRDD